ncbi:arginase [Pseudoalteromonas piscicida]|uniref:arginase n=1 Tax=Pseudoalteromonas piscicida TaxID=43662 RepID=UPI000E35EEEA|nr:arginase [Pseudoalteromonas piscicida]AXQ99546.1 arginase [Pseudoalteromonas piscicida]
MLRKDLLMVECGIGAGVLGAEQGPSLIFNHMTNYFSVLDKIHTESELYNSDLPTCLNAINTTISDVSQRVESFFKNQESDFLVVLSGDHSTAAGSIAGLKASYPAQRIGVVWIDAHADIHSPYTSPSGNIHGMPLAAAVNDDHLELKVREVCRVTSQLWNKTKSICNGAINYSDIFYLGIRDLEPQEWNIVETNKISNLTPEQINEMRADEVVSRVLSVLKDCDHIYISFDIDSLDLSLVPGTGTPVKGGLNEGVTIEILKALLENPKVKLFECVEFNPSLDNDNETLNRVLRILKEALFREKLQD